MSNSKPMSELQHHSPGRQIYYWFGDAFGITGNKEAGHDILLYMGTKERVEQALFDGKRSKHPKKNEILDRELSVAPEYYKERTKISDSGVSR
jgi:hypothetical protein